MNLTLSIISTSESSNLLDLNKFLGIVTSFCLVSPKHYPKVKSFCDTFKLNLLYDPSELSLKEQKLKLLELAPKNSYVFFIEDNSTIDIEFFNLEKDFYAIDIETDGKITTELRLFKNFDVTIKDNIYYSFITEEPITFTEKIKIKREKRNLTFLEISSLPPTKENLLQLLIWKFENKKDLNGLLELFELIIYNDNDEENYNEKYKDIIYYAHYIVSKFYMEKNEIEEAKKYVEKVYTINKDRSEALFLLGRALKDKHSHSDAIKYLKMAAEINLPTFKFLVESLIYNSLISADIVVSSYYIKETNLGLHHLHKLLNSREVPKYIKDSSINAFACFYIEKAKFSFKPIHVKLPPLDDNSGHYMPANPAIIKYKNEYWVAYRLLNYLQHNAIVQLYCDDSNLFKSKIAISVYDLEWNYKRNFILNSPYMSTEDPRLFVYNEEVWFLFACFKPPARIFIGTIRNDKIKTLVELYSPNGNNSLTEKNWLPLVIDEKINIIYSHNPYIVISPQMIDNFPNGRVSQLKNLNINMGHIKGSAPPVKLENEYVGLNHLSPVYDKKRRYMFQWFFYDLNLNPISTSGFFYVKSQSVEFSCGMCLNAEGDSLYVGLGIEDRDISIFVVPIVYFKTIKRYPITY